MSPPTPALPSLPISLPTDALEEIRAIHGEATEKAQAARQRAARARGQGLMQKVQHYQGEAQAYEWIARRLLNSFEVPF